MDAIENEGVFEELPCWPAIGLVDQLRDCGFARAVDADEEVELAFGSLHLCDIDVEEADRIALEALPLWLVALDVGQARYAVSLQAPMQQ